MAKQSFTKVKDHPGVMTRPATVKTATGKIKPDLSYYVRYRRDGKEKWEFVGRESKHKMTAARATVIRDKLIEGLPVKLPNPKKKKALSFNVAIGDSSDQSADDYMAGDIENRPPEYWNFDRLFNLYVEMNGGENGYSNYKSDRGNYNNHVKRFIAHLMPQDMTAFKVQLIRNKLSKKTKILAGPAASYRATKKKLEIAKLEAQQTKKKMEKIRLELTIKKLEAKQKETQQKIKANKRPLSKTTVERCIELIRRLANFGADHNLCPGPPQRIRLKRLDNEKTEDLTPDQIARLFAACDQDPDQDVADMIRLALLVGLRRGSIFTLAWQNINFQKSVLTIKTIEHRGRHSKGGQQINLPISPAARAILETRAALADLSFSPYVFPARDGGPRRDARKVAKRIMRAAGLPDDFRPFHGQRHAFASNLVNTGQVDLYQIGKLLGHSPNSPTMTQRYSHIRDEALRRAADLMGDIVTGAIEAQDEAQDADNDTKGDKAS